MTKTMQSTLVFKTIKTKTLAAIIAIAAAVALPQAFHVLGAVSDLGTALGETFLPMHFAIFAVGFFAGPVAGAVAGALSPLRAASPLLSFWLTAMPKAPMLPFMMIELCVYGLVTGLLANVRMPVIGKLLIAQIAGRGVRALAIVIGFYAFSSPVAPAVIVNSLLPGLPGLILQWVILPLLVFRVTQRDAHES